MYLFFICLRSVYAYARHYVSGLSVCECVCVRASGCAVQFSDESALEVCNTWYALYKSTFLPFFTFTCVLLARCRTEQWTDLHQTLVDDVLEGTDERV